MKSLRVTSDWKGRKFAWTATSGSFGQWMLSRWRIGGQPHRILVSRVYRKPRDTSPVIAIASTAPRSLRNFTCLVKLNVSLSRADSSSVQISPAFHAGQTVQSYLSFASALTHAASRYESMAMRILTQYPASILRGSSTNSFVHDFRVVETVRLPDLAQSIKALMGRASARVPLDNTLASTWYESVRAFSERFVSQLSSHATGAGVSIALTRSSVIKMFRSASSLAVLDKAGPVGAKRLQRPMMPLLLHHRATGPETAETMLPGWVSSLILSVPRSSDRSGHNLLGGQTDAAGTRVSIEFRNNGAAAAPFAMTPPPMYFAKSGGNAGGQNTAVALREVEKLLKQVQSQRPAPAPVEVDVPKLASQVYDQFERQLRIDRERRGR